MSLETKSNLLFENFSSDEDDDKESENQILINTESQVFAFKEELTYFENEFLSKLPKNIKYTITLELNLASNMIEGFMIKLEDLYDNALCESIQKLCVAISKFITLITDNDIKIIQNIINKIKKCVGWFVFETINNIWTFCRTLSPNNKYVSIFVSFVAGILSLPYILILKPLYVLCKKITNFFGITNSDKTFSNNVKNQLKILVAKDVNTIQIKDIEKIIAEYEERISQITSYAITSSRYQNHDDNCSICLCGLKDKMCAKIIHCDHIYHKDCLNKWFKRQKSCPFCKSVNVELEEGFFLVEN